MSEQDPPRPQDDPDDPLGVLFRAARAVPHARVEAVRTRLEVPSPAPRRLRLPLAGLALVAVGLAGYALRPTAAAPPSRPVVALVAPPIEVPVAAPPAPPPERAAELEAPSPTRSLRRPRLEAAEAPVAEVAQAVALAPAAVAEVAPSEYALLARARRLLSRDPAGARRALDEHARLYPTGLLAEERDALRVEWLVVSGRRAEAESARAGFERAYPQSAHRARLANRMRAP